MLQCLIDLLGCVSVVEAVVNFAYTGEIQLNIKQVLHLFLLAHNLGCSELLSRCVSFMKERQVP